MKPMHPSNVTTHRRPKLRLAAVLLLSSFAIRYSALAQSASPQVIPFQGRLTNQAGTPYNNGQYSIIYNLYGQAVGGGTLWTERHEKVGVVNGMVNVFLGSINALTTVDFSTVKYLGITVDVDNNPATADPEMVPRQMIIPAFWAKQADNSSNSAKMAGKDWTTIIQDGLGNPSNDPSTGFVKGAKIGAASITSTQLAANAVTSTQLAANSVTSVQIKDGEVQTSDIANGTVTAFKLAPRTLGITADEGQVGASGLINFLTLSATLTSVPNSNITLKTTGRPVLLALFSWDPSSETSAVSVTGTNATAIDGRIIVERRVGSGAWVKVGNGKVTIVVGGAAANLRLTGVPASSFLFLDAPAQGTYEYRLSARVTGDGSQNQFNIDNARLVAFEL